MSQHFGEATPEELVFALDKRVTFRHFVKEYYSPRMWNGVQHRSKTRSNVTWVEGKPFVTYDGELTEITADVAVIEGVDRPILYDIRVKSPYLK